MYEVGEFVVHEGSGVCKIEEISEMALSGRGSEKIYYVMTPYYEKGSRVVTPVESTNVRMRPVMTKGEVETLISEMPEVEEIIEDNDKQRLLKYKEAIQAFEPVELVRIIKTVYKGKKRRLDAGKKILMGDERYTQIAQKKLYEEIAFAMEMDVKDVEGMINEKIGNTEEI
ncbi:MAG: CarD family transcriptional regulator [Lachnospiraceae bacterium]|nr:CarD family transcriptional regulator [Lachnospiraceae bacterium]